MTQFDEMAQHAANATQLLKELANVNRLMICCCLGEEEMSVGELNQQIPLSQSALSQHLARLRDADIVSTRKDGLTVYYKLNGENALKVILTLKSIYCP